MRGIARREAYGVLIEILISIKVLAVDPLLRKRSNVATVQLKLIDIDERIRQENARYEIRPQARRTKVI